MSKKFVYLDKTIYFHYVNDNVGTDMQIIDVGYEKCDINKKPLGPLQRRNYIIHYVISGEGTLTLDNEKYKISAGEIFLIPPHVNMYYFQSPENPWEYFWFEFSGYIAKTLCDMAFLTKENPVYRPENKELFYVLSEMIDAAENSKTLSLHCLSHIYKFFALVIDERKEIADTNGSRQNANVKKAIAYIEKNYHEPRTALSAVATEIALNPSYLSRIFKEVTGVPISAYISNIRMKKACELLAKKEYSIKEVALNVGYTDQLFFSKEFKKRFGITPKLYQSEGIAFKE